MKAYTRVRAIILLALRGVSEATGWKGGNDGTR
jgi:hypothetical protein